MIEIMGYKDWMIIPLIIMIVAFIKVEVEILRLLGNWIISKFNIDDKIKKELQCQ